MRNAVHALLGLMAALAVLAFSGGSSQAASAGSPGAVGQTMSKESVVQKVYHYRNHSHRRWGSDGGHNRWRSHHRRGSSRY
jgi:hypothetical protein